MTTRVGGRVSFFLGASRRELGKGPRLDDGGAGGSHSSTDVEDDYPDVYARVDPDDYFAPCLGRMLAKTTRVHRTATAASRVPECQSQESSVSTLVGDGHGTVPVVIRGTDVVSSPDGDLKHFADCIQLALNVSRCSSGTNLGDVEDNCLAPPPILGVKSAPGSGTHSAAASTRGMRSLPPSPPASPPVSPGSSFTPLFRDRQERIEPRAPRDHGLIPINLEPVSPMTLAAAVSTDGYEFDDADDDEDDGLDDDRLDHHLNGGPYSITAGGEPDFDVPAYALDDGNLVLEEHPHVVDRFYDRPLLHDPDVPFVKASPVFDSVDDLFAAHYPELRPGSVEYAYHKGRLLRNRAKLRRLAEKLRREHSARRSRISLARLHRKNSHDRPRVCPDIY